MFTYHQIPTTSGPLGKVNGYWYIVNGNRIYQQNGCAVITRSYEEIKTICEELNDKER